LLSDKRKFSDFDLVFLRLFPEGGFLAAQVVSAVDVSADGNLITAGAMAFSHDSNVWQVGLSANERNGVPRQLLQQTEQSLGLDAAPAGTKLD